MTTLQGTRDVNWPIAIILTATIALAVVLLAFLAVAMCMECSGDSPTWKTFAAAAIAWPMLTPLLLLLTSDISRSMTYPEHDGQTISLAHGIRNLDCPAILKDICRASKALSKTARLAMPATAIYSALENIPVHEAYRHLQTRLRISKTKENA